MQLYLQSTRHQHIEKCLNTVPPNHSSLDLGNALITNKTFFFAGLTTHLLLNTLWHFNHMTLKETKQGGCTGHKAVLLLPGIQQYQGELVSSPPWWQPATSCSWSIPLAWHKAPGCPVVFSFGASSSSVPFLHAEISRRGQRTWQGLYHRVFQH